jgi:hypothetical protein
MPEIHMKQRLSILFLLCICCAATLFLFRRPAVLFLRTHKPFNSMYGFVRDRVKPKIPIMLPSKVGNNMAASEILIQNPMGIVETSNRDVLFSDRGRYIWSVSPSGEARIIAGTGYPGYSQSGVAAVEAALRSPEAMCLDKDGNLYFADSHNHVVQQLDLSGNLITVAGTNLPGYAGDAGPATDAWLNFPYDVAIDSHGNLYIADYQNRRIRKVDTAGIISTFAGTGSQGYSGDGGPATDANLGGPYSLCVDADDNVVIADSDNHRIRRVDRDGIIDTIAGTGVMGYSGDGGPATDALFDTPQELVIAKDGRLFIGDEHNHCIRILETDGTISSFVGDGQPGFEGDGGHYKDARLNDPECLVICSDGRILIADGKNGRIRVITTDGVINTFAGVGLP